MPRAPLQPPGDPVREDVSPPFPEDSGPEGPKALPWVHSCTRSAGTRWSGPLLNTRLRDPLAGSTPVAFSP